ncbi:nuclear transport factor 2 family protein [Streptomyces mirabilis]|uniref:nuclear transport factor 2 family protein n=1 Tax=Streptomyces mirabilis TaxID=68239 RepID=UPI00364A290F
MNVTDIATRWLEMLEQPDTNAFAELFTEDGMYIDPAYGVVQRGRDFVRLHHRMWHASVPDFKTKVERVVVDGLTAVILYQGTGTYSGEPIAAGEKHAPTNRWFEARVAIVLDLDDNGLVKCCTEYYDHTIMPLGEETAYGGGNAGL